MISEIFCHAKMNKQSHTIQSILKQKDFACHSIQHLQYSSGHKEREMVQALPMLPGKYSESLIKEDLAEQYIRGKDAGRDFYQASIAESNDHEHLIV